MTSGLCRAYLPVGLCEVQAKRHQKPLPVKEFKGQSKRHSFIEAWINILVGFSITFVANLLIFPLFGFHISLLANFWMGVIYTGISLVRSYFIRRYFNAVMVRLHLREKGDENG
jgi:hypothetical protein